MKGLMDDLRRRGIAAPVLIRFNDILKMRIAHIYNAFHNAIREYNYRGSYRAVMPIKVNQQRHVVAELLKCGDTFGVGDPQVREEIVKIVKGVVHE